MFLFADAESSSVLGFIIFCWAAIKVTDWMKKAAGSEGAKKTAKVGALMLFKRFFG